MDIIPTIVAVSFVLAFFIVYVACAAWAVSDAQRRGHTGGIIILFLWLFGPIAAIIWRFSRPKETLAEKTPGSYENADDMISAATRLEMLGDWDAALTMYEQAALQWPEHQQYANNCIDRIKERRSGCA